MLSYYVSLRYEFRVVRLGFSQKMKTCSVRLYLQLFVGGFMSYLRYLCFFGDSDVQHILCCVFVLFSFVLLPVSLDCSFLIALSVFFNVCWKQCM